MHYNHKEKTTPFRYKSEISHPLILLVKSRYLYIGFIVLCAGLGLNVASQTYLHNYISEGKTLPMLSDLILDNIPVLNVALIYDIVALIPIIIALLFIFQKNNYNRIPFFLLLVGIFYIMRGIFIVLTPFGNPPMFNGSDPLFHGFANYELGVYPSGHAGFVFLLLLLVKDSVLRWIIGICLIIVICSLFLAHGHYSIDILSGIFFSYAIYSYGEKHFSMFDLGSPFKY